MSHVQKQDEADLTANADHSAPPGAAREAVTTLLHAASQGESGALERLVDLLYDELRWLAHRHLLRESQRNPITTTELVHEAFLKLVGGQRLPAHNRRHFLGAASRAMRQVLVTEARRRQAGKRQADGPQVPLEMVSAEDPVEQILAINTALDELAELELRTAQVVECRFFAGLSVEETAEALATSTRTVKRDWRKARAWLLQRLGKVDF